MIPKKKERKSAQVRAPKLLYDAYFIFRNKHLSTDLLNLPVTIYNIFQNFRLLFQNEKGPLSIIFSAKREEKGEQFCVV